MAHTSVADPFQKVACNLAFSKIQRRSTKNMTCALNRGMLIQEIPPLENSPSPWNSESARLNGMSMPSTQAAPLAANLWRWCEHFVVFEIFPAQSESWVASVCGRNE